MKPEIKGNVLLYDTDPKNQEELRNLLENEGLSVTQVNSIEEIVEEVWKNRPLGVLLSVYDESEYQRALEICQKLYEYKDVPIVIINRFSMDFHHTVEALSAGAFEHFLSHTSNDNAVKRFIKVIEETSKNRPQTAQSQVQKPEHTQKVPESTIKSELIEEEIFLRKEPETSIPAAAPPTGKLEDISISELVEIFRNQIFDGRVVIKSDAAVAELEFRNGELESVKTGKKKDINALREINNWKRGDFWIYYRANPLSPLSAERFNMLLETGVPLEFLESQFPTVELPSSQQTAFEGSQPEELQGILAEKPEEPQQPAVEEAQPEELEALLSQMEQQAEQQLEAAQQPEAPQQGIFEEAQPEELQGILAEKTEEPQQPAVEEAQPEEVERKVPQIFAEETKLETARAEAELEVPVAEKPATDLEKLIQAAEVAEHKLKEKITAEEAEPSVKKPSETWESLSEDIHNKLKESAFQFSNLHFVCVIDPLNKKWTYYRVENENPEETRDIFVNLIQNSEFLFGEGLEETMGQSKHFIYLISSLKGGNYYFGAKIVRGDSPLGAIRLIAREIRKKLEELL